MTKLRELNELIQVIESHLQDAVAYRQLKRQLKVERRFFNPRHTKKEATKNLAAKLQKSRLVAGDDKVVAIDEIEPARR